ncbi:Gp19/Gp15/Gp42 family protein [Bifidobacterium psychraerophilum]|uniref:Gp19/Gp15/Gp42 family protein n=1 Tax=Bifidobacterium psychraerophilum TaxID=218140 RepID=UPI0039EB0F82
MADNPAPPFAQVSDLEARWHTLTASEQAQAKVLIDDASQMVIDTCPRYVTASAATLKGIVCTMVKRAMIQGADSDLAGVGSTQQTAGPFNESFNYVNPMGDLYLTKAEKQRLGKGTQRAFSIDMGGGCGS